MSTQQAKEGHVGGKDLLLQTSSFQILFSTGMMKFARGAKHFQAQQFEKYKENCQKQFELQNQ